MRENVKFVSGCLVRRKKSRVIRNPLCMAPAARKWFANTRLIAKKTAIGCATLISWGVCSVYVIAVYVKL